MIRRPLASFKSLNGGDNSTATLRNRRKCWEQHVGFSFLNNDEAYWNAIDSDIVAFRRVPTQDRG
jgi:hypothetical protein